jgi:hypothetical protein
LEEATRLIDGLSCRPAAPSVAAAIYHKTEGNPFFLEGVVRHLQAEGCDLTEPRTAGKDWGIPEGVRQVTGRRLSRLNPEANLLLQAGAILDDGFTSTCYEPSPASRRRSLWTPWTKPSARA